MFDEIDLKIISLLGKDGRASIRSIAKQCNVSAGTVRNRIEGLTKAGVIVGYLARIRSSAINQDDIIIGFDIAPEGFTKALAEISSMPFVKELYRTSGDHVAIARVSAENGSSSMIMDELSKVEGVKKVYPAFVQDIVK